MPNSIVIILHLLIHLTVLTTLWSKKFYYPYYLDEETEQEVISPGSPNQAVVEAEIKPKSMLWTPTSHQEKVGWWLERGQESWGRVFQEVKWTHRKAYRELEEGGWRWEMSFTLGIMWTAVLFGWGCHTKEMTGGCFWSYQAFSVWALFSTLADTL